jgi:hypothetical protein
VNVCASIFKEEFPAWVKLRVEARNERVALEKDINISVDPEIAKAFNMSTSVSLSKGCGYQ